jgi:hypothetical protein
MAQFSGVPAKSAVSESLKFGHFLTYTYAHLWDYKQATPEIKKQWVTGERTMERKLKKKKKRKKRQTIFMIVCDESGMPMWKGEASDSARSFIW